jgi:hypothetical protein
VISKSPNSQDTATTPACRSLGAGRNCSNYTNFSVFSTTKTLRTSQMEQVKQNLLLFILLFPLSLFSLVTLLAHINLLAQPPFAIRVWLFFVCAYSERSDTPSVAILRTK